MWSDETSPAAVGLAVAWGVAVTVSILAGARAGLSLGDAVLAPTWVCVGLAVAIRVGADRRALSLAGVLVVVAGLARGWRLFAGLDFVPPAGVTTALGRAALFAAVGLVCYDIRVVRTSSAGG